jgi:hypothetical protein
LGRSSRRALLRALLLICPAVLLWLALSTNDSRYMSRHLLLARVESVAHAVIKSLSWQ